MRRRAEDEKLNCSAGIGFRQYAHGSGVSATAVGCGFVIDGTAGIEFAGAAREHKVRTDSSTLVVAVSHR